MIEMISLAILCMISTVAGYWAIDYCSGARAAMLKNKEWEKEKSENSDSIIKNTECK